jgi:hypothetical protein
MIYQNKGMGIFTGNGGIIKTKWNEVFIKNRAVLIKGGWVKLITEWKREGQLRKCLRCFVNINRSSKRIRVCAKIYDEITKIV